jgi:hypothetical protein
MTNSAIVYAICAKRHLRRLFHLHNQVIDRAILGFPARSLRFLGTTGIGRSDDELTCSFGQVAADRQVSLETVFSAFTGIEFRLNRKERPLS